jgi:thiol-disulfide isomerase/thioredoxin
MLELGTQAPAFALPEPATGNTVSLQDYAGAPVVVAFICNHCPYVKRIKEGLSTFARDYAERGLGFVAINANDVATYSDDSPEKMIADVEQFGYEFPYLFDDNQTAAAAYRAACTPDFFLFDAEHKLVYRGQFDDARPSNDVPVTGADLRAAADAVLAGASPSEDQKASIGCNIKWKSGKEPAYAA